MDRLSEEGLYDQTVVQIDVQPRQFPNLIDLNGDETGTEDQLRAFVRVLARQAARDVFEAEMKRTAVQ